ncbi:MAG: YgiT-type zinc finger protein [Bacteroidota bacterium]|nr:YgiT-type zinc finger protein [Bacteroidota bacterium]MDP4242618.1 YgiT-type zinc finger protein [Bacteroidota bacterium]MDP4286820.1 YgiT-type zinc finger protein [Bacteroidota bacterium]
MFICHVCGSHEADKKFVSESFGIRGETVLVEQIPATVCRQCGEIIFDLDTAEHVREMLNDHAVPSRRISIPVYEYA